MDVDGCQNNSANAVNYVEHVQCQISLKFFPRGDLKIVLTSPLGTKSVLLFERPLDITKSTFDDWPFLSVHFWGEKIVGRWELKITRRMTNSTARIPGKLFQITLLIIFYKNRFVCFFYIGLLKKWQLIFYGTSEPPVRLMPRKKLFNQNQTKAKIKLNEKEV